MNPVISCNACSLGQAGVPDVTMIDQTGQENREKRMNAKINDLEAAMIALESAVADSRAAMAAVKAPGATKADNQALRNAKAAERLARDIYSIETHYHFYGR